MAARALARPCAGRALAHPAQGSYPAILLDALEDDHVLLLRASNFGLQRLLAAVGDVGLARRVHAPPRLFAPPPARDSAAAAETASQVYSEVEGKHPSSFQFDPPPAR